MISGTAFSALALVGAVAMQAQLPDRLRSSPSPQANEEARKVMMRYGACIADAEPEQARAYVLSDNDALVDDELDDLLDPRCMALSGGKMQIHSFLLRGALAERLIEKRLSANALDGVAQVAPLNATYPGNGILSENYTYMYRIGECVARTDPAGARTLLETRMDHKDEVAAIQQLAPTIGGCVPRGEPVQIDRVRLRLGLAVVYYRLADALAADGGA